ncbi:hypothetical protein [Rickettsia amblyommatis]|uniref:hypothetical protein n=1 Tax=Rickettsia amblyommatis TaxID=33989 RepID=UPI0006A7EE8A|nr:hypothetical protein [Rickettsia amblyommatis]ALA62313.1 hypothetical protein AL573_07545 [Rickettsia amblyommatis]
MEVDASPNLDFGSTASKSSYVPQPSQQQPKKKPLLSRAAHKVSKRLGFSSGKQEQKQPEITLAELKELYTAEYGESMDATIRGRDTGGIDGLAETLKRTLALREKT